MKKNRRIESLIESLGPARSVLPVAGADRCYLAFFQLFNARRYFDAHEVLEHLWLSLRDKSGGKDPDHDYFKGLIQVAGAFVHLQKQFLRPHHPKDASRLRPASRLFALAMRNLIPYGPTHLSLDIQAVHRLCKAQMDEILASGYTLNPWRPETAPILMLRP
jgi:predicted metal-dependent hydrolase